jgi:hypothetical protein
LLLHHYKEASVVVELAMDCLAKLRQVTATLPVLEIQIKFVAVVGATVFTK